MIKHLRSMTMLLGKLGIKCMVDEYTPRALSHYPTVYYGVELARSKLYTERYIDKTGVGS